MAVPPQVRPGDLITADFVNGLLQELVALEGRVTILEAGSTTTTGGLVITSITPPGTQASPLREQSEARIAGSNFRLSVGATRVFFNDTPVAAYKPGSNDSLLIFDVPILPISPPLPVTGAVLTLRLENGQESTTRSVLVLPQVTDLEGDIDVIFRDDIPNPAPNPIVPGQAATFAYRLRSRVNLEAVFDIVPVISLPDVQPTLQVLDSNQQQLLGSSINLRPGEEQLFFIRIPSIPAAAANANFSLNIGASSGNVEGLDPRSFTVGQPVQPSDPTISLSSPRFSATDSSGHDLPTAAYDVASNTIRLPQGAQAAMDYTVTFAGTGTYQVTAVLGANTVGWTVHPVPTSFIESLANQSEAPRFTVRPTVQASAAGTVVFAIQRDGQALNQTRTYNLALIQAG